MPLPSVRRRSPLPGINRTNRLGGARTPRPPPSRPPPAYASSGGLLDQGADPNAKTLLPGWCNHPVTPLSVAAACGHAEVASLLLQRGAHADLPVGDGMTPLYLAAQFGHAQLVALLLSARASTEVAKADGATPMLVASHQGHAEVRALRTVRAPPPRSPHSTTSPTPRHPPRQVVELLIFAGASPTAVAGNTVLSALDIATAAGHARCAALLAAHGACPGMQM